MNHALLLPILMLMPLAGALLLACLPQGMSNAIRSLALIASLAVFGLSLAIAGQYDWSCTASAQMLLNLPWASGLGLVFGFGLTDSISLWLVLLTTFLMPITILGSFTAIQDRVKEFFLWLLLLESAMLGTFMATDLVFFYICFEFTLVPLYFLIGIFGSTQRLKAARVFFLYTFTGSMLTFAGVLYVAWFNTQLPATHHALAGQWTFSIPAIQAAAQAMSSSQQFWVLLAMLAGFAVKVPLWPLHTWLPLAHTEAPTAGSVILAGVLLKLGTYGMLRLAIPMVPQAAVDLAPYVGVLAVMGILCTALICWVQSDIKKLVAYSSVSHLGFCVLGMMAMNGPGGTGSVLYMINHGLSTGALFLCIGMIYERLHSREMDRMSGLAKVMPVWASFMVFFSLASVGLPGLNGFIGEFLSLLGAFQSAMVLGQGSASQAMVLAAIAGIGMILGAIYLLYMLGKVVWGPLKIVTDESHGAGEQAHHHAALKDLNFREILTLLPLAIVCLAIGLYPKPMLQSLEKPVQAIYAPANAAAISRVATAPLPACEPVSRSTPSTTASMISTKPLTEPKR